MIGLYEVGDKVVIREEVLSVVLEKTKLFYTGKQLTVVGKRGNWVDFMPGMHRITSSTDIKHLKPA